MKTENTENRRSFTSVGITSLVLIFVMLCLLTFSVLSLVTARANLQLSRRSADRTSAWYDAENRACDVLLEIADCADACLEDADLQSEASDSGFYAEMRERLEGQSGIAFTDERTLWYEVSLTEEQQLHVEIALSLTPYEDGGHYQILEWRSVSSHEWESDESLPLLDENTLSDMLLEE